MQSKPGKLKPVRSSATYPTLRQAAAAGGSLLTGLGAAVLAVGLGGCLDDSKDGSDTDGLPDAHVGYWVDGAPPAPPDASSTDGQPDAIPMIDAQVITDGTPPPPRDAGWLDSAGVAALDAGPDAGPDAAQPDAAAAPDALAR